LAPIAVDHPYPPTIILHGRISLRSLIGNTLRNRWQDCGNT